MLKNETREIDGVQYVIGQIPATRSVKLLARLGRVLGPALGEVAKLFEGVDFGDGKPFAEKDVHLEHAGEVVRALFSTLTDAEIDALLRELLSNVAALGGDAAGPLEGNPKKIDAHFSGRLDAMFRVLFASLEVNFGSFFGVVAAILPKRKAAPAATAADASTSPST